MTKFETVIPMWKFQIIIKKKKKSLVMFSVVKVVRKIELLYSFFLLVFGNELLHSFLLFKA